MSISGSLEDVSVAEVMQFIHIGRRTGTLVIQAPDGRGEVGFHRGRIISAWAPDSQKLGDLLIARGLLERARLDELLERQERERPRRSLGQLLVDDGLLQAGQIREAVSQQIEETVYRLVTWRRGTFEFALDELRPVDDIGVYPGDILPDINLNTQMLVLEALRIFDEKNRRDRDVEEEATPGPADEPTWVGRETDRLFADQPAVAEAPEDRPAVADDRPPATAEAAGADAEIEASLRLLAGLPEAELVAAEEAAEPAAERVRIHAVSTDREWLAAVEEAVPREVAEIAPVELRDAGLTLPGSSPPLVLLDLRAGDPGFAAIADLTRSRPHAAILAVLGEELPPAPAYAAGALAVVPAEPEAVAACVRAVVRERAEPRGAGRPAAGSAFARLRRVVADLRSGLLSATVALNLMNVISESVERAIMFLVREQHLVALGAFGNSMGGQPLAELTRRLVIDLEERNALCEAIDDGQTRSMSFDDAALPAEFAGLVGRPRTGQIVVFPVLGSSRVISVIYTDNGPLSKSIEEIEILELAAAQVGVAFENELLRRKMAREASE